MPRGGSRPGAGRPRKGEERTAKAVLASAAALPANPPAKDDESPAALADLTPLDYLLSIVRDPGKDQRLRMQAASIAAPYCHPRQGEGGKKDAKQAAAKQVAGRFAQAAPPKLVAAGGKKV